MGLPLKVKRVFRFGNIGMLTQALDTSRNEASKFGS